MTARVFRTIPALLLSLPGVLLLLAASLALVLHADGALEPSGHRVPDAAIYLIAAGVILVPATLTTTPIALFYTLKRAGGGLFQIILAIFNGLMGLLALAGLAVLLLVIPLVMFNPG